MPRKHTKKTTKKSKKIVKEKYNAISTKHLLPARLIPGKPLHIRKPPSGLSY
jgi:hypothetical protein